MVNKWVLLIWVNLTMNAAFLLFNVVAMAMVLGTGLAWSHFVGIFVHGLFFSFWKAHHEQES